MSEENKNQQEQVLEAEEAPVLTNEQGDTVTQTPARDVAIPLVYKLVIIVAFLLAIFAVAASYAIWMELEKTTGKLATQVDARLSQKLDTQTLTNATQLDHIEKLAGQNRVSVQQLSQYLDNIKQQLDQQSRTDYRLIQAESILRLARNQYEIMRDRETTLFAMQRALDLIKGYADPGIIMIKETLLTEMQAIKNLHMPDISSHIGNVDMLLKNIDSLPLITSVPDAGIDKEKSGTTSEPEQGWQGMLEAIKPLLTIRRRNVPTMPLLSVEEEKLVRMIMKSRCEMIRLALQNNDSVSLRSNTALAKQWLNTYFHAGSTEVSNAMLTLNKLDKLLLDVAYPETGAALQQLVSFRQQQIVVPPQ